MTISSYGISNSPSKTQGFCGGMFRIYRVIRNDCLGTVVQRQFRTNFGKNNHHLTIPFEGGMHSFKRQGACVSRN